ncbi:hypothetical protein GH733_000202, partial [Mirounga leonina]
IGRIQYKIEYSEHIGQRTRVPKRLKVVSPNADLEQGFQGVPNAKICAVGGLKRERSVIKKTRFSKMGSWSGLTPSMACPGEIQPL